MAPRPVGELQQLLNNLVDLLLVHQVETFFNREQHPIVGRGWRLLTAVIMAQGRPRSRVALRRVPYSRVSQRTLVQARLEPDDQHPKQRAYARAYQAAPEAEPTTATRKEAIAGQQHSADDHRDPGVDTEIYAEELE